MQNLLRCSWSPDGSKVAAGSADRFVHVWDTTSRRLLYKLPGHNGSVNEIQFHPKEPIGQYLHTETILYKQSSDHSKAVVQAFQCNTKALSSNLFLCQILKADMMCCSSEVEHKNWK